MRKKLLLIDGVEPACERCAFWYEADDAFGICQRFPPVLCAQPREADAEPGDDWCQPLTWEKDWCGEFRKAELEEVAGQ